jgi:hypothetical protein
LRVARVLRGALSVEAINADRDELDLDDVIAEVEADERLQPAI